MNLDASYFGAGLNASQKQAVMNTEGPLLIVAGPGTGKTLTIVRRIAYLIHKGVRPEAILAVTFTNRAAREMKERTAEVLGKGAGKIFIGTFHLLGLRIIRGSRADDFVLVNRDEQAELLKSLLKCTATKARQAVENISRLKNSQDDSDEETRDIYEAYQSALRRIGAVDFDDLILTPTDILWNDPSNRFNTMFTHIMVDEYQDINPAQYRLLRQLAHSGASICAIGDSDQAIYGFRGADSGSFLRFCHDFKNAATVTLTENYRSTGTVLAAAGSLIKNNTKRIEKGVFSTKEQGRRVCVISVPDERAEAEFIVRQIEARVGGTSHARMRQASGTTENFGSAFGFSDFAVIFRTNAQAKAMEEAFSVSGIPYQVIGRKNSLQSKEIDETLAFLRSLAMPDGSADTIPRDSKEAKLLTAADYFDPRADAVALTTLHTAKGLEFKVVFIAGVEDGLLPYTMMREGADIEEERRLFYVGMTRAQDELFLIHARSRFLYGQRLVPSPSPFLNEVPAALVDIAVIEDKMQKQKEPDRQMGLF